MKIQHNLVEFPNIFLTYYLNTKEVSIEKIEEKDEKPGVCTNLVLTIEETKAIILALQHFYDLFNYDLLKPKSPENVITFWIQQLTKKLKKGFFNGYNKCFQR